MKKLQKMLEQKEAYRNEVMLELYKKQKKATRKELEKELICVKAQIDLLRYLIHN